MDDKLKSADELLTQEEDRRKVREKQLTKKAISFFRENTCSIDIIRDNNLYQIYFPKLPYCKQLPKDVKSEFHNDVDRTSSKTKLTQLMVDSDQIIKLMKHEVTNHIHIIGTTEDLLQLQSHIGHICQLR